MHFLFGWFAISDSALLFFLKAMQRLRLAVRRLSGATPILSTTITLVEGLKLQRRSEELNEESNFSIYKGHYGQLRYSFSPLSYRIGKAFAKQDYARAVTEWEEFCNDPFTMHSKDYDIVHITALREVIQSYGFLMLDDKGDFENFGGYAKRIVELMGSTHAESAISQSGVLWLLAVKALQDSIHLEKKHFFVVQLCSLFEKSKIKFSDLAGRFPADLISRMVNSMLTTKSHNELLCTFWMNHEHEFKRNDDIWKEKELLRQLIQIAAQRKNSVIVDSILKRFERNEDSELIFAALDLVKESPKDCLSFITYQNMKANGVHFDASSFSIVLHALAKKESSEEDIQNFIQVWNDAWNTGCNDAELIELALCFLNKHERYTNTLSIIQDVFSRENMSNESLKRVLKFLFSAAIAQHKITDALILLKDRNLSLPFECYLDLLRGCSSIDEVDIISDFVSNASPDRYSEISDRSIFELIRELAQSYARLNHWERAIMLFDRYPQILKQFYSQNDRRLNLQLCPTIFANVILERIIQKEGAFKNNGDELQICCFRTLASRLSEQVNAKFGNRFGIVLNSQGLLIRMI
jgi:hypothetical protein